MVYYRRILRDFRFGVERHRAGEAKFDTLYYNFRANCLLSYFAGILGAYVTYDHGSCESIDATIGGKFMLGSDLQFLFRYCLVVHLTEMKNQSKFLLSLFESLTYLLFSFSSGFSPRALDGTTKGDLWLFHFNGGTYRLFST